MFSTCDVSVEEEEEEKGNDKLLIAERGREEEEHGLTKQRKENPWQTKKCKFFFSQTLK